MGAGQRRLAPKAQTEQTALGAAAGAAARVRLRELRASSDQLRELGALEAVVPAIELSKPY